jgi:cell division protein FtsX
MKETATKDMIRQIIMQIYIVIVIMIFLKCCFIIALEAIEYVTDSVGL